MAKKTIFAVQNQHFPICTHPHRVKKKFHFFGVFIGLSEAPWHADSKKCIHVHSKYCSKLVKKVKNLRERTILGKFPDVFYIFDPLAIIFAMDMYTFLESARQGAADKPIKTPKS